MRFGDQPAAHHAHRFALGRATRDLRGAARHGTGPYSGQKRL